MSRRSRCSPEFKELAVKRTKSASLTVKEVAESAFMLEQGILLVSNVVPKNLFN